MGQGDGAEFFVADRKVGFALDPIADIFEKLPLKEWKGVVSGLVPSADADGNNQVVDAFLVSYVGPGGDADGLGESPFRRGCWVACVVLNISLGEKVAKFGEGAIDLLAGFAFRVLVEGKDPRTIGSSKAA